MQSGKTCPTCRHDNAPGHRFCARCGARLSVSASGKPMLARLGLALLFFFGAFLWYRAVTLIPPAAPPPARPAQLTAAPSPTSAPAQPARAASTPVRRAAAAIATPTPAPIPTPAPTTAVAQPTRTQPRVVEPSPATGATSGDDYYVNTRGKRVRRPVFSDSAPAGATARCRDGSYSFSQSRRGTCSHHGGVAAWL